MPNKADNKIWSGLRSFRKVKETIVIKGAVGSIVAYYSGPYTHLKHIPAIEIFLQNYETNWYVLGVNNGLAPS